MRYVFLAYRDERQSGAMSAHERAVLESACAANEQDLWQSGRLLAVEDVPVLAVRLHEPLADDADRGVAPIR